MLTFLHLNTEFHCSYVLQLLINFSVMAATYYSKTKRQFQVSMCEYLGLSALTGYQIQRPKGDDDSAIK